MSLNKSALVLISALLGLSCTQALPTHHQWEAIKENPVDESIIIHPMTKLYSTKSNFIADQIMPPEDDVPESARYNKDTSMIVEPHPEVVEKPSPFVKTIGEPGFFTGNGAISGPEFFAENEAFAKNGVFSGKGAFAGYGALTESELLSRAGAIAHQPEHVIEKTEIRYISLKDLLTRIRGFKEALQEFSSAITCNEDEVTSTTATPSSPPSVLIETTTASKPEPIESSEGRVTTPRTATTTTSAPLLVLTEPNEVFELDLTPYYR